MSEPAQPPPSLPLFAAARERLESYCATPCGGPIVITGPAGAGKTSFLRRVGPSDRLVVLDCFPGVFCAELMDALAVAFMARNDTRLHDAVAGQAPFPAQLDVLAEVLAATDACIVVEDVDHAHSGFLTACASQRREFEELALRMCACAERGCRVIVTAEDAALLPEAFACAPHTTIALPELDPEELAAFWRAHGGSGDAAIFTRPLGLKLAATASVRSEAVSHADFAALCLHVWCHLSPDARVLLSALAHAGGPLTRGLVRTLARDAGLATHAAPELAAWGLTETGPDTGNRIFLNPALARAVQDLVARRGDDCTPNWTLLGDFWTESGRRTRTVWDLIRGLGMYFTGNNLQAAYERQRDAIETLLGRDALDLADEILSRTLTRAQGRMRAVVLGNLAIVRKNQGDYAAARTLYEEARHQFDALGDGNNVARVLHQLGNTYYLQGAMDAALEHYEESRAIAAQCGDESVGTAAQIQIANIHFTLGNMDEAARHYQQGLAKAERLGDRRMLCAVLLQLGHIHVVRRSLLEAAEALERADLLAHELNDPATRTRVLQLRALTAKYRGDLERAAAFLADAIALATTLRDHALLGALHYHLGHMQAERGDLLAALKHLAAATQILSELGTKEAKAAWSLIQELSLQLGQGRFRQLAFQAGVPWVVIEDATGEDDTR